MLDNESIDKMRKQIQQSLIETKQQQLRDEFGMQFDLDDLLTALR